ncbi:hypothetical protein CDD81_477 [Ophiocordyceps australis]|uniref:Serine hydrolase domain-containing protein n=1 Tax=Ophiocordyceps australis TaxID=1399860 RepID=A0A2C5Y107_9HYPO|nr:hypothetical protein CDD81_477 [Ophiocordyceps australis]
MKFLCLHGSYGSAHNFETQLVPFINEMEKSTPGRFKCINGFQATKAPRGFEDYFGAPPLYKFFERDGASAVNRFVEALRDFPPGLSPEDSIRLFIEKQDEPYDCEGFHKTMSQLHKVIADDPDIEGILGYSEGAMVAATLILEERRKWEREGVPRRIKCGIFFAGWPPVRVIDNVVEYLLADECEDVIDIPTCHVVGCKDPYINGSMALYDICDQDQAVLFDHGKGHTLPREPQVIRELSTAVNASIRMSRAMVDS